VTRADVAQLLRRSAVTGLAALLLGGCLDAPEIEDRWTRVDIEASNLVPGQALTTGATVPVALQTSIIYRAIHTGFAGAELRASATLGPNDVFVHPNAGRERMAYDIDRILTNSVSVGRGTRAITGWTHLIQRIDFNFNAWVPAALDSAGVPVGAPRGLFLVTYLGSGEEIELPGGGDTLVVTPFPSGQYQILPSGMTLNRQ
jgi:hypothetical protein